ncbi:TetR/AcrR family transcriptional regulator [Spongiibacter tropicus]|uniref:TetR/AcrR family transcriptional regulator n=1 Tax=Spongiibacter tropicus TaxID=454602 RepID=UPI0003B7768F|nr:TetR family transcriptional regulator [Spongiibacter tropicus]
MGRPAKPIISRERAVRAALEVIDENGVEGLSLQLVAKRLGVKAPSLYYHFKNKAEILSDVARLLFSDVVTREDVEYENWREEQAALAVATRRSILSHPKAAPLLLQFFPRYLMLKAYDNWSGRVDLPVEQRMQVIEGIEKLTLGSALFGAMSAATQTDPMPAFPAEKFPHLSEAIDANPLSEDEMFEAVLRAFLYAF